MCVCGSGGVGLLEQREEGGAHLVRAEAVADVLAQLVERHDALDEHLHLVVEAEGELREELHQRVVVGHHRGLRHQAARGGEQPGALLAP